LKANREEYIKIVATGAILILIGIALGAFGAHGLKEQLSSAQLMSFETGVRYQIYHGIAIMIIGFNLEKLNFLPKLIIKLMLTGVILFSGSIYFLACKDLLALSAIPKATYLITPLGGVFLMSSWFVFIVKILKKQAI
jgi:uncharacterized membrane protein YgdD (TMEM256/DUF423 family)